MTCAVIDNATLTAVQRLLGNAPTKSEHSIDVDVAAFENYVQARLFLDEVATIDDYKPQYRKERHKQFDNIYFIPKDDICLTGVHDAAEAISKSVRPKIQGGKFQDKDFKELLDLLNLQMICTWDIRSSVYHLTLKIIAEQKGVEFDKYGALATAIFQELGDLNSSDGEFSGNPILIDRYGNPIGKNYKVPGAKSGRGTSAPPAGAVIAFAAALTWLATRSIFYTVASTQLKASSFLFPIRQYYQQNYLSKHGMFGANLPNALMNEFAKRINTDAVAVLTGGTASAIDIPIISAWLVLKTGDTRRALEHLEEIRDNNEFLESREILADIHYNFCENKTDVFNDKIRNFRAKLKRISKSMQSLYGTQARQRIPLTRVATGYNTIAKHAKLPPAPKFNFDIPLPRFFHSIRPEWGFCSVFRSAMNDLTQIGGLGEINTLFRKHITMDTSSASYNPKAESPEWVGKHTHFSSPM